jgi:hypothetical protein
MYLQYRAENRPLPHVRHIDQLGGLIEARVKPGLDVLYDDELKKAPNVAYAGYALADYIHPLQRLEDRYFDPNDPRRPNQSFWLRGEHCFDAALARKTLDSSHQHVSKQDGFRENGYILGPVVRFAVHPFFLNGDEYNQDENLVFSTKHAVFIPGEVLLDQGMYEADPMLREGFAVNSYAPYEYLANTFDLQGTIYVH